MIPNTIHFFFFHFLYILYTYTHTHAAGQVHHRFHPNNHTRNQTSQFLPQSSPWLAYQLSPRNYLLYQTRLKPSPAPAQQTAVPTPPDPGSVPSPGLAPVPAADPRPGPDSYRPCRGSYPVLVLDTISASVPFHENVFDDIHPHPPIKRGQHREFDC